MSLRPGRPRFIVSEIEGWPIDQRNPRQGALTNHHRPMISVSVLDTAYCYEEVGRWNQEDYRGKRTEVALAMCRVPAQALADALNREYAP